MCVHTIWVVPLTGPYPAGQMTSQTSPGRVPVQSRAVPTARGMVSIAGQAISMTLPSQSPSLLQSPWWQQHRQTERPTSSVHWVGDQAALGFWTKLLTQASVCLHLLLILRRPSSHLVSVWQDCSFPWQTVVLVHSSLEAASR